MNNTSEKPILGTILGQIYVVYCTLGVLEFVLSARIHQTLVITSKQWSSSITSCLRVSIDDVLPIRSSAQSRGDCVNIVFKNLWPDLGTMALFARRALVIFDLRRLRMARISQNHLPTTSSSPILSPHGIRMTGTPTTPSRTVQMASRGYNFSAVASFIDA